MQKRSSRAVVGVIAGVVALCLLHLPASANSLPAVIMGASFEVYNADDELVTTIGLGGPAPICGTTTSMIHATGSSTAGDLWGSVASLRPLFIGGLEYVATITLTFTGTYSNIGATTKYVTVVADLTMTLHRSTTANSCTPNPEFGDCSFSAFSIVLDGTLSHSGMMPTLTSDDMVQLSGASGPATVVVVGSAANCGILLGATLGYVVVPFLNFRII